MAKETKDRSPETRRSAWRRRAATLATAAVAAGAFATAVGPSASASAYGCTLQDGVIKMEVKGPIEVGLPSRWCGGPNGSGLHLDNVVAGFSTLTAPFYLLCDTSMKVEVFDNRGRSVWVGYSPISKGCFQAYNAFKVEVNKTFSTEGHVETSLLSYGVKVAMLSHTLKG